MSLPRMINNKDKLVQVLKSINSSSCPNNINFHCHTTFSDGSLSPSELIAQARYIGLQHIAITDHHTTSSYNDVSLLDNIKQNDVMKTLKIWTGIEISALLKGCLVHILGLGFEVDHHALKPYSNSEAAVGNKLQAINVIKSISEAGGLSILAHPARYRLPYDLLIQEAYSLGIDGIETWYDYELKENWSHSSFICNKVDDLRIKLNLLSSCGTDTHGYNLHGR